MGIGPRTYRRYTDDALCHPNQSSVVRSTYVPPVPLLLFLQRRCTLRYHHSAEGCANPTGPLDLEPLLYRPHNCLFPYDHLPVASWTVIKETMAWDKCPASFPMFDLMHRSSDFKVHHHCGSFDSRGSFILFICISNFIFTYKGFPSRVRVLCLDFIFWMIFFLRHVNSLIFRGCLCL